MTRLNALDPEVASGKSKKLFDGIQSKLGMVPNMMRTMGNSSSVLEGYLNLSETLGQGSLGPKVGELIALTVAESNACDYCLSAHTFVGDKLAGIDPDSLSKARDAGNSDPKIEAILGFARTLVERRGKVSDRDVDAVREAGLTEGEIGEVIAHVALNIFTNYFNNTAKTKIDFPEVNAAEMVG